MANFRKMVEAITKAFTRTENAVVEVVDQVYIDMSDAFERMGHAEGVALGGFDTLKYIENSAGRAMVGIGFSDDGTWNIYKNDVVVETGYWLPYEATASDYRIKRTGIVGSPNGSSTLATSYSVFVADHRSKDVFIDSTTVGKLTHSTDIYIKHEPSGIESVFRIHLEVNVS